jgi:type I restriction enzyme S subunit
MKRLRINDSEDHVTEQGLGKGTRLVPKGTTFLLTRGMTLLNDVPVTIAGRPMTFNQDVKAVIPREGVRQDFVPYLLLGLKEQLRGLVDLAGHGTGRLNTHELRSLNVLLPPHEEQRAIADILGTLDDKIELNRRMNETLEAIARALFKSWFVDFDPVRAKAEGRDTGLPAHIAALFPDSFEDSELGEIPEGWQIGLVGEQAALTMGQSPPGNTYNETGDGLPFYQGRADFTQRFPRRRIYCTAPTRFAKAGDTLVSVRAPVGDINMAAEECAIGRGVAAVRHLSGSRSYTYMLMHSLKDAFNRFEGEGTVFGSIGRKDFHAIPCIVPPATLVQAFERSAAALDDHIENGARQVHTLAALRDTLLPKLLSGEIRVRHATATVGAGV